MKSVDWFFPPDWQAFLVGEVELRDLHVSSAFFWNFDYCSIKKRGFSGLFYRLLTTEHKRRPLTHRPLYYCYCYCYSCYHFGRYSLSPCSDASVGCCRYCWLWRARSRTQDGDMKHYCYCQWWVMKSWGGDLAKPCFRWCSIRHLRCSLSDLLAARPAHSWTSEHVHLKAHCSDRFGYYCCAYVAGDSAGWSHSVKRTWSRLTTGFQTMAS